MNKVKLYSERTNLWTLLIAFIIAILGVVLLCIAANWRWLIEKPGWQTVIRDFGSLLIVSVSIALIWELVAKRAFVAELMAMAKLAEDVRSAGIIEIPHDFIRDIEWPRLLRTVQKLDIFFAYGRTWRGTLSPELRALATREGVRVRVILPDPENQILMPVLARRFNMEIEKLREMIIAAKEDFIGIFTMTPGAVSDLSVWYLTTNPVFSFYRFDHIAILALYKHSHGRGHIPTFIIEQGGTFYDFIRQEFDACIQESNGLARKVYPDEDEQRLEEA